MTAHIAFGPFALDPDRSLLPRDGAPVPIGQRTSAVLAALLAAQGEAVAKADPMARVLPGVIGSVSPHAAPPRRRGQRRTAMLTTLSIVSSSRAGSGVRLPRWRSW
jgi:hypothetical protein